MVYYIIIHFSYRGRFGLDGGFEKRIAIGSLVTARTGLTGATAFGRVFAQAKILPNLPKTKRNDNNNYSFAA